MKRIKSRLFLTGLIIILLFIDCELAGQEPAAKRGKVVTVKGLRMYYEETGKGMPLVLLHSFFETTSQWKPFIPEFSRHYRVIAVDLPGHGNSDWMDTTDVYLHKRAAEYIIGLLDTLKVDSAYIIGASSGGFITLYITTLRPQLAKKITVIGGQVYYSMQNRKFIESLRPATERPERLAASITKHGKEKGTLLEKQFWRFRNLYGDPAFTPDLLSTITAQAFIIHGDKDVIAPLANALDMYNSISKSYLWVVPNGGHLPHLEQSNQSDFIRRTIAFMSNQWVK